MAPSSGHLLVPKILRIARFAAAKTEQLIRSKFPGLNTSGKAVVQPVPVYARNQPTHPLAYIKQLRSQSKRLFSTHTRTLVSTTARTRKAVKFDRSQFQSTQVGRNLQRCSVSPFASTLRPNLTGGALPRSAGGYSLGGVGRVRHFSHTSGCQAQVISNVSAGVRAFFVGGGKVRYDGVSPITGGQRFKAVTATQEKAYDCFDRNAAKMRGTSLEFRLSPTVTALSPVSSGSDATPGTTLQTPELLSTLSGDFARSLRSLSQIVGDLERLSALGELPISLEKTPEGDIIRVRFPGCDADLVTRLCDEFAVIRGTVVEDVEWESDKEVKMALLFPFAPTKAAATDIELEASDYFALNDVVETQAWQDQLNWRGLHFSSESSLHSPSADGILVEDVTMRSVPDQVRSPSGYGSIEDNRAWSPSHLKTRSLASTEDRRFEGVEGIYNFLRTCDEAKWGYGQ